METFKNTFNYYIRDAKEGIRRNFGASLAAIVLIFISITITGTLYIFKTGISQFEGYLQDQIQIKLFLDPSINANDVVKILKTKSYVNSVTIETKADMLKKFESLFKGKEYLMEAFKDTQMPDAINIELKDKNQVAQVANELKSTNGITDVIYPQEFAQKIIDWSNVADKYEIAILILFAFISFMTVSLAINLAMHQRRDEIRIKLLLGAKESHVKGQFLFEGFLLGLIASLLSGIVIYWLATTLFQTLSNSYSSIFHLQSGFAGIAMLIIALMGSFIGVAGAYMATRKWMKHA